MSATNRKKRTAEHPEGELTPRMGQDHYPTQAWVTRVLVKRLGFTLAGKRVLECAAGDGAMVSVLAAAGAIVDAVEIDPGRAAIIRNMGDARVRQVVRGDFLLPSTRAALEAVQRASGGRKPYDLVATNPPYGIREIVIGEDGKPRMVKRKGKLEPVTKYRDLALEFAQTCLAYAPTVAFMLRLNWAGSEARYAFHEANPADLVVLSKRPQFRVEKGTDSAEYAWWIWREGASVGTWVVDPCEEAPKRGRPKKPIEIVEAEAPAVLSSEPAPGVETIPGAMPSATV